MGNWTSSGVGQQPQMPLLGEFASFDQCDEAGRPYINIRMLVSL